MPISTQDSEPNIDIVVQITEPYERPTAKTVLVFRAEGLDIPWPEGLTVKQALLKWRYEWTADRPYCPECYDYHESEHKIMPIGDNQAMRVTT